jgi:uncharacterized protein YegL
MSYNEFQLMNSNSENIVKNEVITSSQEYNDDDPIEINNIKHVDQESTIDLEKDFTFNLKLKHSLLKESSCPITIPMLTDLFTKEGNSNAKTNIDLICLIDKSGSMQGEKINLLKQSFENILEYLGENDRLSIASFNSSASRLTPLLKMNSKNKSETLNKIKSINAAGGTKIGKAFAEAVKIIKQRRYVNAVTSILILSDGLDDDAESNIRNQITKDSDIGVFTINTYGYGSDHDPNMMSALCSMKDGSFYYIDKLDTMDEVFIDCLGALISVVSPKVKLEIEASDNQYLPVEIVKAYGPSGFWKQKGNVYEAEILQMIAGKKYNHVLEVRISKLNSEVAAKTFLIAYAICTLTDLNGKEIVKKASCEITFDDEEDNPDEDVMINAYRVQVAEIIKVQINLRKIRNTKMQKSS